MNYRHAFHAGNFADVAKHALLCLLVETFHRKEKPFRVVDTHAGRGLYDLRGDEAARTGEAADGIALLLRSKAWDDPLLAGYRAAVERCRELHSADSYPGSPLVIRSLLRRGDRLSAYELHPEEAEHLRALFAGDVAVKAIELDGWLALGAHLPPKERRGLVLIDPPFEEADEIDRIVDALGRAHRRWPGGTYAIWYPIKQPDRLRRLHDSLRASGIPDIVALDFLREEIVRDERLVGSGLAVVNPPYTFTQNAEAVLRLLLPVLGRDRSARCGAKVLAGEGS